MGRGWEKRSSVGWGLSQDISKSMEIPTTKQIGGIFYRQINLNLLENLKTSARCEI